ncbi:MAG: HAD family hydrolase [Brevefilum sp.]|nr:HAD family hydrolase [Brevefilum sp.]
MKFDLIGFDADDTLWHTEIHYTQAQDDFKQLLNPWAAAERIDVILNECILNNLPGYGYGIKAFILSLIEAAILISDGKIRGDQIEQILSIGKAMKSADVVLRLHVKETLQNLVSTYRLMVITKGDLLDQTTKVEHSGIASFFSSVEVVNDKNVETYAAILEKHAVDPHHFLMVGNTIRSDVHPVLALGGTAVHIPADTTWDHEMVPGFDTTQNGFYELEHMGQLPALIDRINHAY